MGALEGRIGRAAERGAGRGSSHRGQRARSEAGSRAGTIQRRRGAGQSRGWPPAGRVGRVAGSRGAKMWRPRCGRGSLQKGRGRKAEPGWPPAGAKGADAGLERRGESTDGCLRRRPNAQPDNGCTALPHHPPSTGSSVDPYCHSLSRVDAGRRNAVR